MDRKSLSRIDKALLSLENLTPDEIEEILESLQQEERRLSRKRRQLHEKIDEARREILSRLKNSRRKAKKEIFENLVNSLISPIVNLPQNIHAAKEREVEYFDDLSKLSFEELENYYHTLKEEEAIVSFKRRWVQGKVDLLRNWLDIKQSVQAGVSDEEFARMLTKFLSEKGF